MEDREDAARQVPPPIDAVVPPPRQRALPSDPYTREGTLIPIEEPLPEYLAPQTSDGVDAGPSQESVESALPPADQSGAELDTPV